MARSLETWTEVGRRVADARESAGLTQEALALDAGVERTALAKIELGRRGLNSLELARLASALSRPIEWFVTEPPPSVVSRRAEQVDHVDGLDPHIDGFARDVELLIELKALQSIEGPEPQVLETVDDAERLAAAVREEISRPHGPIPSLAGAVERLGLYAASIELSEQLPDGAYVALEGAGATVINGTHDAGRRRFTLAHELGHHAIADEYSTDWWVGDVKEDREKRINAFAIHFLMPRESVVKDWSVSGGREDPRGAAMRLATDYRMSWTAACAHFQNLGLIERGVANDLRGRPPTRPDLLERGLFVVEELAPPTVSPGFAKATLRAYRGSKITARRAIELLRGTLERDELPPVDVVPRDALRADVADSV